MKKYLLASSALASVMLVSGFASAEQSLSGFVYTQLHTGDVYDELNFRIADAELRWNAVKTTDSGLDAKLEIQVDGNSIGSAFNLDDAGVELSGDFGKVAFGTFDNAAASFETYAASVASGSGGTDAYFQTGFDAYHENFSEADDLVSLSYFSNDLSGLSFGVSIINSSTPSFSDDGAATSEKTPMTGTALGGAYSAEFGESSLQVRFGSSSIESTNYAARTSIVSAGVVGDNRELSETNVGVIYGISGFSVAVATNTKEFKENGVVDTDVSYTDIGLGYSFGTGSASYGSTTFSDETAGSTVKDQELTALSATYNLGEGVSLLLDQLSGDIGQVSGGPVADGSETILGIVVSF